MKHFLTLLSISVTTMLFSQNSGWEALNHNGFVDLQYADFNNDQLGMAVEDDKYHITKDGGKTWKTTQYPGLRGRNCKVFVKNSDTLFLASSDRSNTVYFSYGYHQKLDTLNSHDFCSSNFGSTLVSTFTALNGGDVIYVAGCRKDSAYAASSIFITYDLGRSWKKHTFHSLPTSQYLAEIVHRNQDTLILRWYHIKSGFPVEYSEFYVDTFATRLTARANMEPAKSITCEGFQCLYNNEVYFKGNQFFFKTKTGLAVDKSRSIAATKFFDKDEFLLLPQTIPANRISTITAYHVAGDTIDATTTYDIGPDAILTHWRNISVTEYSVYAVSNSRIYKNAKEKVGLRENALNSLINLKIFQSPGSVSVTGLENQSYSFKLYSATGSLLSTGDLSYLNNYISTSKANKGIYLLSIENTSSKEQAVFKVLL